MRYNKEFNNINKKSLFVRLKGKGPLIVTIVTVIMFLLTILSLFVFKFDGADTGEIVETVTQEEEVVEPVSELYYGISSDSVRQITDKIGNGQTLTTMLAPYGVNARMVHEMVQMSKGIFDTRSMKLGYDYTVLLSNTSDSIRHFIYQINPIDYVIYSFYGNSIKVEKCSKPIEVNRKELFVTINSSLWESIVKAGGSAAMVISIENILQWTLDFYGIRKGDIIALVYDEQVVDGNPIGHSRIHAVSFRQDGKSKYAIYFDNGKVKGYWDDKGNSLKRAFLKAPLRYSRISSKFTYSRFHPVHKIYRPHTGVDYAAPKGTPVESVADGVVIEKKFNRGAGNMIKIRHSISGSYVTGYMHLNGFAKGINVGSRVSQGQVIGYVGSTGTSTGPHLDFRVWKAGKPIDPLKLGNQGGEPLSDKVKVEFLSQTSDMLDALKKIEIEGEKKITKEELRLMEKERKAELENEEKISKTIPIVEHDQK